MAGVADAFEAAVYQCQVYLFRSHFLLGVGKVGPEYELCFHLFSAHILPVFVHHEVLPDAEKVSFKGALKLRELPVHYILVEDHNRALVVFAGFVGAAVAEAPDPVNIFFSVFLIHER